MLATDKKSYESRIDNVFMLQRSKIIKNKLIFENPVSFDQALKDGFFLVKIPEEIDVSTGLELCHNFYKEKDGNNDEYKGFKNLNEIYFDREHFQTEHIMPDKPKREKYFPKEVNSMCQKMTELAIIILKNVLIKLNIPETEWTLATGGSTESQGTQWFACSHYRSEIDKPGCPTHQDTGFVTVLYIEEPGLEAYIEGKWQKINPESGYFIINFGKSFEILTEKLGMPVKSIVHRVIQTNKISNKLDRVSMAAFLNSPSESKLYQYTEDRKLNFYQTVEEFLAEFNKITWSDKYTDFGIKHTI